MPCGHPDGARMARAKDGRIVDECWACMVEREIHVNELARKKK